MEEENTPKEGPAARGAGIEAGKGKSKGKGKAKGKRKAAADQGGQAVEQGSAFGLAEVAVPPQQAQGRAVPAAPDAGIGSASLSGGLFAEAVALVEAGGPLVGPKSTLPTADSLNLVVHIHSEDDEVRARAVAAPLTLHLTATDKLITAVDAICSAWELDSSKVRLWDYNSLMTLTPALT